MSAPISVPGTSELSQAERCWQLVRAATYRQLPLESALSLPVPAGNLDLPEITGFYYGILRGAQPHDTRARRPLARLTGEYPSGRLISFVTRKAETLFPQLPDHQDLVPVVEVAFQPHERRKIKEAYYSVFEDTAHCFWSGQVVDDTARRFAELFRQLMEPGLQVYYQALNPAFFSWIEGKE